jgi:hypothetical protein
MNSLHLKPEKQKKQNQHFQPIGSTDHLNNQMIRRSWKGKYNESTVDAVTFQRDVLKMSYQTIAEDLHIGSSATVRRMYMTGVKQRKENLRRRGRKSKLTSDEENLIENYIFDFQRRGKVVSGSTVTKFAKRHWF